MIFPDFRIPIVEGQPVDDYVQKTAALCVMGPNQTRLKKGENIFLTETIF